MPSLFASALSSTTSRLSSLFLSFTENRTSITFGLPVAGLCALLLKVASFELPQDDNIIHIIQNTTILVFTHLFFLILFTIYLAFLIFLFLVSYLFYYYLFVLIIINKYMLTIFYVSFYSNIFLFEYQKLYYHLRPICLSKILFQYILSFSYLQVNYNHSCYIESCNYRLLFF